MGKVKKLDDTELIGKVKVIDPKPIWYHEFPSGTKAFMQTDFAIDWELQGKKVKRKDDEI